jgi:hypothetical protein
MQPSEHPIDAAFRACIPAIERDGLLADELAAAVGEFGAGPPEGERDSDLWRRRLLEWFVLERVGDALRAPPLDELLAAAEEAGLEDLTAQAASLRGSLASVFCVTGVEPERGLWLRDLAARGEYPVSEPDAAEYFQNGDLIAGRIFPLEDGSWHVSRAAAFFRNGDLTRAVEQDLERARAGRRGPLRISQLELERMFYADASRAPSDPVGDLRALLVAAGLERDEIERLVERLAATPFDGAQVLPGGDAMLGDVLDRLAFDTSADLDEARRLLILAWGALATRTPGIGRELRPAPARAARATAPDVPRAVAEFERRRAEGAPLERAFQDLEAELGLEPGDSEEEPGPAPDFPGVVGAVVEEYLWELRDVRHESASAHAGLRLFGRFAQDIGVFENLGLRELRAYTCHWLPENGGLESADAAREHLAIFGRFLRWVEETQGLELHATFKQDLRGLESSLPRIVEANRRRTRSADPATGELWTCVSVAPGGGCTLRNAGGLELESVLDPEIATWLAPGDFLRGRRLDDGRVAVYCCYPPEARGLVGR